MISRVIFLLLISITISGCAGMAQQGALSRAYSNFQDGDYEDVIELTSNAERYQEPTHQMKAEIIYLKALALEKLGREKEAQGLFKYLSQEFIDTQYGFMAKEKL
jgi:outer membrane protein assembly factor BamD (BamD/ComL family)